MQLKQGPGGAVVGLIGILMVGCSDPAVDASAAESESAAAPEPYSARNFYETTSYYLAGSRAWSADGKRLLIGSDESGTVNAYALSVDALSTDGADRVALTESKTTAQRPVSWFPADDRMLFTSDNEGDELTHLYVRELDGAVVDLTPGNLKAQFLDWLDDGLSFFVVTNERDQGAFDLYRYNATDYARELVFTNQGGWLPAAVSRDGRHLALAKLNRSADNDIFLVDLSSAEQEPVLITPHEGSVAHRVYGFTPDNGSLVFGTNGHGEFAQAWTHDLANGAQAPLVVADWDVSFLFYSESGRYRITGINEDALMSIQIMDLETGDSVTLPGLPEGNPAQIRFSPDEQFVALMLSTDTSPNDIYVVDRTSGISQRVTRAPNPEIDESRLVAGRVVRYPSFDGLEIPGILYQPQGASASRPVPAVVFVHGGPGGQSRRGYSALFQHLVNQGYAVLAANNRGSSGYGKTFYHMDDRKHGEVDLDDIVYAQKYLAGLDWVDDSRIGIIGGSYGGYMVGAALAFRPGVFKVGINIFGVMNWLRTLESMPPWWEAQRKALYDELGDPAVDAERLRRISPLFHAENINVPLLVVQGANDPRVLQVESDEIVAAVRENEVPVEYIVFEDEGHGFTQRENKITASDAYADFLRMHL